MGQQRRRHRRRRQRERPPRRPRRHHRDAALRRRQGRGLGGQGRQARQLREDAHHEGQVRGPGSRPGRRSRPSPRRRPSAASPRSRARAASSASRASRASGSTPACWPTSRYLVAKYKIRITDGYAMEGHAAAGEHPIGLALDIVPGPGGSWNDIDKLAKWAEPRQNRPRAPFRWVGYNGDANHGRGNHLHLSWRHTPSQARPARRRRLAPRTRARRARQRSPSLVSLARASNRASAASRRSRAACARPSRCTGAER